jgi:hypothetical protein
LKRELREEKRMGEEEGVEIRKRKEGLKKIRLK